MQLSVIILNYNVRYFLEQCVQSVQAALHGIDSEIIVVDNNSPDDSCTMMKSRFPEVKLIENKVNTGFPKGNNIGVASAKGRYICILNPDTVVAEDTFSKVLAFAQKQQNLGIIGVKLVDGTGNFLPESKRGVPTPKVAITKILGLYKVFPKAKAFTKYYAEHLEQNQTGKVDILVGAFMFMERNLYNEVGGFDEDYFMYSEDMDLSYTVLQKGRNNYYFHEATVVHYKGESTVKDSAYMKNFVNATKFFYQKHFKGSVAFNLFMAAGTVFFVFAKKNKAATVRVPDNYILFSDDKNLKAILEKRLQKKVTLHIEYDDNALLSQSFSGKAAQEIIFDNNVVSYGNIIAAMEKHCGRGYNFKIKPARADFIIGSNSSNDRGEIILLEETRDQQPLQIIEETGTN
jgi:GT2 family glycosyltransferase